MASWKRRTTVTCGCVLAVALAGGTAQANGDRRMDRDLSLFERVLDDVLVESPNWLVRSHHETRGHYRTGEGARFSIDASLTGGNDNWFDSSWVKGMWHSDHVYVIRGDDDDDDEKDTKKLDKDDKKSLRKSYMDHEMKRGERLYKRGKAELVDAILEYGDLLQAIPDTEFVTLDVDLRNADYFDDKDIDTLTIKAKMADVRAFNDGKIDEKTMIERIQVTES